MNEPFDAEEWEEEDDVIGAFVILDGKDLVTHLEDAWEGIRAEREFERMPRGVTFISGPSATSDIQGHRVTGAHGPQRLHLIYLGPVEDDLLEKTGHPPRDSI